MRRGQVQTMEPILVVMILALLFGVALFFVFRLAGDQDLESARKIADEEAIATLSIMATLPELSCPSSITAGTPCIDTYKAAVFSERMQNDEDRLRYIGLLGPSEIYLTNIDLVAGGPNQPLLLYDSLQDKNRTTVMRTYFTAYDPVHRENQFSVIEIVRELP